MESADAGEEREGIWDQFRWSVLALAMDAEVQLSLFPDFTCKADELALDFDHWFRVAKAQFPEEFSNGRLQALEAIDQKLEAMSFGGPLFDEFGWGEDALRTRSEWSEVRSLAKHASHQFGWRLEVPPYGRSQYVQYRPDDT